MLHPAEELRGRDLEGVPTGVNVTKPFFLVSFGAAGFCSTVLNSGGRKPTHLTSVFSLRTSVLTSAKAVRVVPSGGDKMVVHGC
jgi:hypothetical protein